MAYRMSVKIDAKGYNNMIGTEFEGCGADAAFVFLHLNRGVVTTVDRLVKGVDKDEIFNGIFYDKDCYMFLLTEEKSNGNKDDRKYEEVIKGGSPFRWKIFIWKGAKASLIQFGFAGTKAKDLQSKLVENGNFHDCTIVKEAQGSESDEFKSFFFGDINAKKGSRNQADKASKGDAPVQKAPKMFEVTQDRLRRIPIRKDCLAPDRNFILDTGAEVFSYSGPKCGRVERAYTEEMARRRCKADYRKKVKAKHVLDVDKTMMAKFHAAIEANEQPVWDHWKESYDPVLFKINNDTGTLDQMSNDKADGSAEKAYLFDAELLQKGTMFVLDCQSEVYLWVGKGNSSADVTDAKTLVKGIMSLPGRPNFLTLEVVRQNMETVYFKERFFGFDQTDLLEIGGVVRGVKNEKEFMIYSKDVDPKTKRVSGELKRVVQFLEERHAGFVAENSLQLANDESGMLTAFKYDQNGDMALMEEWEFGFFETTKMYTYIYSCKNESMHYVFTWEGEHASVRAKTVAGISTTGKDIPGITEQMMGTKVFKFITQGREPRLLTLLLEQRDKHMFIKQSIPTERQRNEGKVQEIFLDKRLRKIFAFEINEIGQFGARTAEVPFRTLIENGFSQTCCYLIYRGPSKKQDVLRSSFVNFIPTEVFYFIGERATPNAAKLVMRLASDTVLPRSFGFQDFVTMDTFATDLNDAKARETLWGPDELNISIGVADLLPPTIRPTRLFRISNTLKKVGGMFIHDVGDGAYSQRDLDLKETFLLDTGSSKAYLWIGPQCSKDQVKLGLHVATRYLIRMVPNITIAPDSERLDVDLELIDAGQEPLAFKSSFYGWKNFQPFNKGLAKKFESHLEEFYALARMSDKERHQNEKNRKTNVKSKRLENFKMQQSLQRSRMKTLQKGRIVNFKKTMSEFSMLEKVGERVEVDNATGTLTVNEIGKPLQVLQKDHTIDELCKSITSGEFDWMLFKYNSPTEVEFADRGAEGVDELMGSILTNTDLNDDGTASSSNAFYAVVNIKASQLKTDLTKADRSLFITFVRETTEPLLRAAVNVHRSFMAELLGPCFAEVIIRSLDELDHEKAVEIVSRGH